MVAEEKRLLSEQTLEKIRIKMSLLDQLSFAIGQRSESANRRVTALILSGQGDWMKSLQVFSNSMRIWRAVVKEMSASKLVFKRHRFIDIL